jgi:hypothetical protein
MIKFTKKSGTKFDQLPIGAMFLTEGNTEHVYIKIDSCSCTAICSKSGGVIASFIHTFRVSPPTTDDVTQVKITAMEEV